MTEKIIGAVEVGYYPKEKPGMGQAAKGQLILTDKRLVYVKFRGGKYLRAKVEDFSHRIEEGLKIEGSFEAPLRQIIEAKPGRVLLTSYLRIRYRTDSDEKDCSFILSATWDLFGPTTSKDPYKYMADCIHQWSKKAREES